MRTVLAGLLTWVVLTSTARASDVVVGVASVEGRSTRLLAIDLHTAKHDVLGELQHVAGATPTGTLLRNGQLAVVMPDDGRLLLVDTATARVVETRALDLARNQRPQHDSKHIVAVRQQAGHPVVVDVTTGAQVFSVDVPWLSVVAGSTSVFLTSGTGTSERLDWRAGTITRRVLGAGAFRNAAVRSDGSLLVDVQQPNSPRAQLVQIPADGSIDTAKVIAEGLPGFSPVVLGVRAAAASGRKDGSIVVDDGTGFVRWPGARAGIARPQAIADDGAVVALVDRGAALPAELWLLTKNNGTLLLAPAAGDVVTVYGIAPAKVTP